jgi:hypothetical protein
MLSPALLPLAVTAVVMTSRGSDDDLRGALENAFAECEQRPNTAALEAHIRNVLRTVIADDLRDTLENARAEYKQRPNTAALEALRTAIENSAKKQSPAAKHAKQLVLRAMKILHKPVDKYLNPAPPPRKREPLKELVEKIADEKEFKLKRRPWGLRAGFKSRQPRKVI